jgi:hypothetical protein
MRGPNRVISPLEAKTLTFAYVVTRAREYNLATGTPAARPQEWSTNESTGLSPKRATACSSFQRQFNLVAATFSSPQLAAEVPPGLLIPRSQVRDLPGPSETRPEKFDSTSTTAVLSSQLSPAEPQPIVEHWRVVEGDSAVVGRENQA